MINQGDLQLATPVEPPENLRLPEEKPPTCKKIPRFRRPRSLSPPLPVHQFGPCGRVMKNRSMVMTIQDPEIYNLSWCKPPVTVLVIKKIRDASVISPFIELVYWLIQEKNMVVYVQAAVVEDKHIKHDKSFVEIKDKLMTFRDTKDNLTNKIDFIICLGGDGTLLYASQLFQESVPPLMPFYLGSFGFLTSLNFDHFQERVNNVLDGHPPLTLRSRLRCILIRKHPDQTSKDPTNLQVLNEVIVDRGPSPYLSNIDVFLEGRLITSVKGDGLIISTPTGSTAYAVAAGASIIHPSVPAIMITPICPHSLSFRPIVIPAGVDLKITPSPLARSSSYVSFDGRYQQELKIGDSLRITTSIYPVPSVCAEDPITDWFNSLAECLNWNVRRGSPKNLNVAQTESTATLDSLEQYLCEKTVE